MSDHSAATILKLLARRAETVLRQDAERNGTVDSRSSELRAALVDLREQLVRYAAAL